MISRRAFSTGLAAAAVSGANDTITLGCIGTGGRCRALMRALQKIPKVRIVAIADVWDGARAEAAKLAAPDAVSVREYKRLLDRKDIDGVVIASPDHWHAAMTVDACSAGKDVYVEKPLTHEIAEGARVIDAQNRYARIVQVGMQQRSMPHLQKAFEIVRSGQLGTIHKVHMTWNRNAARGRRAPLGIDPKTVDWRAFVGPARPQEFDEYRFRQWRWFWDFGNGILTDLMVHWLDVVHWYLDLGEPESATAIGDHFAPEWGWETPDTIQALLQYKEKKVQAYFEGTFVNARNAAMTEFMGSNATLYIDRGRYEIHPERGKTGVAASEWLIGEGPRGADFYSQPDGEVLHLEHWLECMRTRKKPNTPAEAGVSVAAAAHLANAAYRSGQVAKRS